MQPAPTQTTDDEKVILRDTGYLQNLFQKRVTVQQLTLTLYSTYLKLEDAKTGAFVNDIPINEIIKIPRYFSSRWKYTLYPFHSTFFTLKRHIKSTRYPGLMWMPKS